MRMLITGGQGFIGSAIVNHFVELGHTVDLLDAMTYAADSERLSSSSHTYVVDIAQPISERMTRQLVERRHDVVLHLAAETHVDNSISDPLRFVHTNVLGTAHLLEAARRMTTLRTLLYFSTDEVFGPAPGDVRYSEWDRYNSGNPYAATKAGAEELVLAYGNTYKLPVLITHTMNVFGPRQHAEKFIPSTVAKVLAGDKVTIHADQTRQRAGSRFYIHTSDVARAVQFVLEQRTLQEKFNIVGEREVDNLALALIIADELGKPLHYELVDFHSARPGHDLRYALDGSKLAAMGWKTTRTFSEALRETVRFIADELAQ